MNLEVTLLTLAAHLQVDSDDLLEYAKEAQALTIGGYHWNQRENVQGWQSGSLWEVEGQMLYILTRFVKPDIAVEIGGFWGCSASWVAAALKRNGGGKMYSVDSGVLNADHGSRISADLRPYVELVNAEGSQWLGARPDNSIGLVFSDADHSIETTQRIAVIGWQKLTPGGMWVEHDAGHDWAILGDGTRIPSDVATKVRTALQMAGIPFRVYLTEPSDCGLGIARKPGMLMGVDPGVGSEPETAKHWMALQDEALNADAQETAESTQTEPPAPKPKRIRKAKAK